jgi:hypothetical protein
MGMCSPKEEADGGQNQQVHLDLDSLQVPFMELSLSLAGEGRTTVDRTPELSS